MSELYTELNALGFGVLINLNQKKAFIYFLNTCMMSCSRNGQPPSSNLTVSVGNMKFNNNIVTMLNV